MHTSHRDRFVPSRLARAARMVLLAAASAGAAHPGRAAEADGAPAGPVQSVTITGDAPKNYGADRAASTTRSDTPLRDTPQSVTVITEKLIKDQAMQSMADVTRYVPGIGMANGEANRDAPIFRGITNTSGDFYIDGVRDDVEYYRDLYNVAQVEALTGPNAMVFGRGGSGGVINRVTKVADWRTQRSVDLTLGSYENKRLTADIDQALNDRVAVRVTGLLEDSGGYQRNFSLKRSGINPTVAIRVGTDTLVRVGYEHFEDRRTADRGVPSFQGRPLDLPVDAFFGDPSRDSRPTRLLSDGLYATIDHDFGHGVRLTNRTRDTYYDKFYQNYNPGAVSADGTTLSLSAYNNHQWRNNLFNQTELHVDAQSGTVKHQLLFGMELGQQNNDFLRRTGVFSNSGTSVTLPLAAADGPQPVDYVLGASSADRNGFTRARVGALYAQDELALSPQWQVIAGLRYDRFDIDYDNRIPGGVGSVAAAPASLSTRDNLVSPRLGVVWKPVDAVSLYANYSVASFPRTGDQLTSLNSVNDGLKPEKFTNYEVGGKWQAAPSLLATIAIYRLNRTNVAITNPATGIADQLASGERVNGVEVGISGNVTRRWSIDGGYAYQDAKLTATASATALAGATVNGVPKNTFALWNRYDFTPAFGAGLGVIVRGEQYASTSNAVVLPGYTRLDGALYYTINRDLQLQLNVENIADRRYYAFANSDNNITPGSPIAARATLHAKF